MSIINSLNIYAAPDFLKQIMRHFKLKSIDDALNYLNELFDIGSTGKRDIGRIYFKAHSLNVDLLRVGKSYLAVNAGKIMICDVPDNRVNITWIPTK